MIQDVKPANKSKARRHLIFQLCKSVFYSPKIDVPNNAWNGGRITFHFAPAFII
jgi:hypothetical protein